MAEASFQERTEQATPKRRDDARKRGQVARSMELNSVAVLFFGLMSLVVFSGWIFHHIAEAFYANVSLIPTLDLTANKSYALFKDNGIRFLTTIFPMMLVLASAGILINFAQVGALFTLEPLTPKAEKLDFIKGFQRIVSKKTAISLLRDIIKVGIIGYVAYLTIKSEIPNLFALADQGVGQILSYSGAMTVKVGLRVCLALLVLAILDYAFQKFEYEKDLRMTHQEIKEEHREFEGDPQIKSRIRRIQREMARKRMLKDVETADVVVTNPTHIAVALRYDIQKDSAPVVVAMGERLIAEKIKEVARKFDIPIIENKPLARALFEAAEIGMTIPSKLYRAVAEVLAFVYKQKGKI